MGIDVFGVFEKRQDDNWSYVKDFYEGRRGLLRYWLGWPDGGCFEKMGVRPIVDRSRGLPDDLLGICDDAYPLPNGRIAVIGQYPSWLLSEEILAAPPLLGIDIHTLPIETGMSDWSLAEWKTVPALSEILSWWYAPRLVAVTTRPENITWQQPDMIPVECIWDFSAIGDFADFIDEVRLLTKEHGGIRFVYGFG